MVVGPINLPVGRLFVEEVITECRKRGATRVDVLAFEFEMGLFPAVLDEAKQKGIDLSPKTIPPEVFDKRAVERGQVRFQDVAFIEVTPRFDKKDPLTLAVELTDFSVYYSQGLADAIAADLKKGKSEVVCDAGALIKISKNKQGLITRDVLTKHWTDWVDYWAVDFNYESRREIIKVPKGAGVNTVQGHLPGQEPSQRELELPATRGALDRRVHLRERVAKLPHPPEAGAGHDHGSSHVRSARALHDRREGNRYFRKRYDNAGTNHGGLAERAAGLMERDQQHPR